MEYQNISKRNLLAGFAPGALITGVSSYAGVVKAAIRKAKKFRTALTVLRSSYGVKGSVEFDWISQKMHRQDCFSREVCLYSRHRVCGL